MIWSFEVSGVSGWYLVRFGFAPGGRSTINVVRAYYDWPTVLDWGNIARAGWGGITGEGMGTNGYRRIVGSAAFLNEP